MLDVRKLRALREVGLRGSFSEAAQRLSYSQSAVSQQIAQLERQVGVRLLDRRGRSVTLTPVGRALVQHTEVILTELTRAQAELDAAAGAPRDSLRLAVPSPSAGTWLPAALQSLRTSRPDLDVSPSITGPCGAAGMVASGDADVGVITGTVSEPGVVVTILIDEQLHIVMPARHPKADEQPLRLADLADENWILTTGPDSDLVVNACRDAGFSPRVTVRTDDTLAAQGLVASGLGLAVMGALESSVGRRADITLRRIGIDRPVSAVTAGTPSGDIESMVDEIRRACRAWLAATAPTQPQPTQPQPTQTPSTQTPSTQTRPTQTRPTQPRVARTRVTRSTQWCACDPVGDAGPGPAGAGTDREVIEMDIDVSVADPARRFATGSRSAVDGLVAGA